MRPRLRLDFTAVLVNLLAASTWGFKIYKLSLDYLQIAASAYTFPDHVEGLAMLKLAGIYYLFGSHLSGWAANDNLYTTAQSLAGPWTPWKPFVPQGSNTLRLANQLYSAGRQGPNDVHGRSLEQRPAI